MELTENKRKCPRCNEEKEASEFTQYYRPSMQRRYLNWCDDCIKSVGNIKSSVYRIDVWTENDDDFLAQTILKYIRHGKTQIQAFHNVGNKLGRAWTAVDHRWNKVLRKQYKEQIAEAKRLRKFKKPK